MKKNKIILITILLIVYPLIGIIVGFAIHKYLPLHYFELYPLIPAYYTFLGLILFLSLIRCLKKNPKKIINIYMMFRGIKFFITIAAVLLYVSLSDRFQYEFSITTIGFYFFYLFVETYIFVKFEKERIAKCKEE